MKETDVPTTLARFAMVLALLLVAGCGAAPEVLPFPPAGPLSTEEQIDLVRTRARAVRTATAVVQVAMESEKYAGAFEIVSIFERPGRLHLSAYKSVLLSTYPIFELTFSEMRYHLRVHRDEDETAEPEEYRGQLEDFPLDHPDLASLYWTSDVLFLPGDFDPGSSPVSPAAGNVRLTTFDAETRRGADVSYELDPLTLAVLAAEVSPPGVETRFRVRYRDYRDVGEAILPHRVTLEERRGPFRLEAEVVDLEVNGEVDAGVFEIDDSGTGDE